MTITDSPHTAPGTCPPWARSRLARLVAPLAWAVSGTSLLWLAARATDVELVVGEGDGARTVGWAAAVVTGLLAALAGVGLLFLLERRPKGRAWFTAIATVVLLLSLAGPLGAATGAARTILLDMHVVVWLALVVTAWRRC
jgi:hypothetical protein